MSSGRSERRAKPGITDMVLPDGNEKDDQNENSIEQMRGAMTKKTRMPLTVRIS
jgi:hypothetical protein